MLIIDRVEGNIAVAFDNGAKIEIPVEKLPNGAKEGSILVEENGIYALDKLEEIKRRKILCQRTSRLFSNNKKDRKS